jgi:hypothetical protein
MFKWIKWSCKTLFHVIEMSWKGYPTKKIEKSRKKIWPYFRLGGLGHVTTKSPHISGLEWKFEKRYGHIK